MTNNKLKIDTWEEELRREKRNIIIGWSVLMLCLLLLLGICFNGCMLAMAEERIDNYSIEQWCIAIRHAEGNANYGILTTYRHTSPKQACINTLRHQWRNYCTTSHSKRFLAYLQEHYCPINSTTDNGTCINWEYNVGYWLRRG